MDLQRAFNYPRTDPRWMSKVLILGLVGVVPLLNAAAVGYMLETIRRVSRGEESELPDWGDFSAYFMDGLRVVVTMLAVIVPLMLVAFGAVMASAMVGGRAAGGVFLLANGLQFLVVAAIWLGMPALLIRLAFTPGFGAGFDATALKAIVTRDSGRYLNLVVLCLVFGAAGSLGMLACGIGMLLTAPYAQLGIAHLVGQFARQGDVAG